MAVMYMELLKRFGTQTTNEIMREVLMKGGQAFFRGFAPLGTEDDLTELTAEISAEFDIQVSSDVIELDILDLEGQCGARVIMPLEPVEEDLANLSTVSPRKAESD